MFFRIIILLAALLVGPASGYGKNVRVLLLPIDMSGAGKYEYLGGALDGMIASRLSADENVELVETESRIQQFESILKNGDQASLFKQLQIDFIAKGAGYDTANGLQLQLSFFTDIEDVAPVTVVMNAAKENEIFPEIENFIQKIETTVFKHDRQSTTDASLGVGGLRAFQTEHPEKAYKQGLYQHAALAGEGKGALVFSKVESSINIDDALVAMARGDLDGDGVAEFVFIATQKLVIARLMEKRLRIVYETSLGKRYKAHGLGLADLDNDGRCEIYISGNESFYPSSGIYVWSQGSGLKALQENLKWYLRPLTDGNGKTILLGQRATRNVETDFLAKEIFKLERSKETGKLIGKDRFSLPEMTNLFDFVVADLDGDKTSEIVVIDKNEKMLVYSSDKKLLWVSDREYGGSQIYLGPSRFQMQNARSYESGGISKELLDQRKYVFIPGRMLVVDVDGDGRDEIIVGQNQFQGVRLLPNIRAYSGGSLSCLKWHDDEMDELWKTRRISAHIADYTFFFVDARGGGKGGVKDAFLITSYRVGNSLLGVSLGKKSKIEIQKLELKQVQ